MTHGFYYQLTHGFYLVTCLIGETIDLIFVAQDVIFSRIYCINPALHVSAGFPSLFDFFQNLLKLGSITAKDKHVVILNACADKHN